MDEKMAPLALDAARLREVDEAMWLRAREGDVAAAKVVYARLAAVVAPAQAVAPPPDWETLKTMFSTLQQQQEGLADDTGVLDDTVSVGIGKAG